MKNYIIRLFNKLLRKLHITKPIPLTAEEVEWIKLIKGHYRKEYSMNAGNWIATLRPKFDEIYGWSAKQNPNDYLNCMFNKLLDIYLKIQQDNSGSNAHLKQIFNESFYRTHRRDYELPIERVIAELCGQIQCNPVRENGIKRYELYS